MKVLHFRARVRIQRGIELLPALKSLVRKAVKRAQREGLLPDGGADE